MIAGRVREVLFYSQIPFGGLNRSMPEANLNLFERGLPLVCRFRKCPPDIVRRYGYAKLVAVGVDEFVNCLRTHSLPRDAVALVDGAEHRARGEAGRGQPFLNGQLGPGWHGDGAEAASLPRDVDDAPAAVALLNVLHPQVGQFLPAQAAAYQQPEQRAIPLPLVAARVRPTASDELR